jgi:hypothetical protein
MTHTHGKPPRRSGLPADAGLGAVFVLGITFTAYMLIISWGGAYWVYTTIVAAVTCALALLRTRQKLWTTAAGAAVTAVAIVVSAVADLPQEPSPMAALGLAVLVGSSIRTLPPRQAIGVAAGGLTVIALVWISGPTGVTIMATLLLAGAVAAGPLLRTHASARRPVAPTAEPPSADGRAEEGRAEDGRAEEGRAEDGRAEDGSVTWPA